MVFMDTVLHHPFTLTHLFQVVMIKFIVSKITDLRWSYAELLMIISV